MEICILLCREFRCFSHLQKSVSALREFLLGEAFSAAILHTSSITFPAGIRPFLPSPSRGELTTAQLSSGNPRGLTFPRPSPNDFQTGLSTSGVIRHGLSIDRRKKLGRVRKAQKKPILWKMSSSPTEMVRREQFANKNLPASNKSVDRERRKFKLGFPVSWLLMYSLIFVDLTFSHLSSWKDISTFQFGSGFGYFPPLVPHHPHPVDRISLMTIRLRDVYGMELKRRARTSSEVREPAFTSHNPACEQLIDNLGRHSGDPGSGFSSRFYFITVRSLTGDKQSVRCRAFKGMRGNET